MRTIEVKLYKFDELSESAKEKARNWFRVSDTFEADFEFAETAAKILGITFATTPVQLMSGKTRYDSDIRYSGFSSQGDGASFVGSYEYAKGCSKAIRAEFGTDEKLCAIADGLTASQKQYGYKLKAEITQDGRGVHKYTMDVETIKLVNLKGYYGEEHVTDETNKELLELMRDFAQWIYDGLEEDYDYRNSDEAVDDTIQANEYEFTEDGERA